MDNWDLKRLVWKPHQPEILSSTDGGRAIVLDLPAGEMLQDHQVHERAWITVVHGHLRITGHAGDPIDAQPGSLVLFAPQERHEVNALADSRLLLVLTPWPDPGHPGAMATEDKAAVRQRAAERTS